MKFNQTVIEIVCYLMTAIKVATIYLERSYIDFFLEIHKRISQVVIFIITKYLGN